MLRQSAQVILPVLSDGNRELLRELEQAGIDYIGTPFEAGELASHKHRYASEAQGFAVTRRCHPHIAESPMRCNPVLQLTNRQTLAQPPCQPTQVHEPFD